MPLLRTTLFFIPLAGNAESGSWNQFQAFLLDRFAAIGAITIGPFFEHFKSAVDILEIPSFA